MTHGPRRRRAAVARLALIGAISCAAAFQPKAGAAAGLFGPSPSRTTAKAHATSAASSVAAQVRQALDERRYVDAGDLLDQAAQAKVNGPDLTCLRGELLLSLGRFSEALAVYRSVEGEATTKALMLQGEGLSLSLLDRSEEALPLLQSATQLDKSLWRAWNGLGREYDIRRDWSKALAAYTAALAAPGVNAAMVLNNRGYSHLLQRQLDLASADFVDALGKDPALSAARTNLRITLAMKGAYVRAATTGAGDDRAAVLNNVGLAAAMRGDYLQAEKLLNEAMAAKGKYYARAAENLQLSHDLAARAEEAPVAPNAPH